MGATRSPQARCAKPKIKRIRLRRRTSAMTDGQISAKSCYPGPDWSEILQFHAHLSAPRHIRPWKSRRLCALGFRNFLNRCVKLWMQHFCGDGLPDLGEILLSWPGLERNYENLPPTYPHPDVFAHGKVDDFASCISRSYHPGPDWSEIPQFHTHYPHPDMFAFGKVGDFAPWILGIFESLCKTMDFLADRP